MNCTPSEPCLLPECKKMSCFQARKDKGLPLGVELPTPGNEFSNAKIANRRLLLTYKTHLDKDAWIEWLTTKTGLTPDFVRLAHETGDKTNPYNHTHCVIDFEKFSKLSTCLISTMRISILIYASSRALKHSRTPRPTSQRRSGKQKIFSSKLLRSRHRLE